MRDHFFRNAVDASTPLLLWALHFFTVYIFTAAACDSTLEQVQLAGYPLVRAVALLLSLIALLLAAGLCWRSVFLYRPTSPTLLSLARLGCAILGTIGIVWTTIPLFILTSCHG